MPVVRRLPAEMVRALRRQHLRGLLVLGVVVAVVGSLVCLAAFFRPLAAGACAVRGPVAARDPGGRHLLCGSPS